MTSLRLAVMILCAVRLAQSAEPDPVEVLRRAAAKVLSSAQRIPNYTCVQTVNRDYFRPVKGKSTRACDAVPDSWGLGKDPLPQERLLITDRLRLDVTMASRGEIFSWAGAGRFEDAAVDQVVRSGPIGTGAFAGFLNSVFRENGRKLAFVKDSILERRRLLEYSFQVAKADSDYRVKLFLPHDEWAMTAYSGAVWIDPESADVVRLSVQTDALPDAAGNCRTMSGIDFDNVKLAGEPFPLPAHALQRFVFPTGEVAENTSTFAACREYRTEATLAFNDPDKLRKKRPRDLPRSLGELPVLPAGLQFMLDLVVPIQTSTAAAGDPFTARLAAPLLDSHGKRLARRGTLVKGHLLRVEVHVPVAEVVMVFKPEILETPGAGTKMHAHLDWQVRPGEIILLRSGEEGGGGFSFANYPVLIPRGFRSEWRTVSPR